MQTAIETAIETMSSVLAKPAVVITTLVVVGIWVYRHEVLALLRRRTGQSGSEEAATHHVARTSYLTPVLKGVTQEQIEAAVTPSVFSPNTSQAVEEELRSQPSDGHKSALSPDLLSVPGAPGARGRGVTVIDEDVVPDPLLEDRKSSQIVDLGDRSGAGESEEDFRAAAAAEARKKERHITHVHFEDVKLIEDEQSILSLNVTYENDAITSEEQGDEVSGSGDEEDIGPVIIMSDDDDDEDEEEENEATGEAERKLVADTEEYFPMLRRGSAVFSSGEKLPELQPFHRGDLSDEDLHRHVTYLQKFVRGMLARKAAAARAKKLVKRYRVAQELLSTERTYVGHLNTMKERYCLPLLGREDVSEGAIATLFGNVEMVYSINRAFLDRLEAIVNDDKWQLVSSCVSDVFEDMGESFLKYVAYMNDYPAAIRLLASERQALEQCADIDLEMSTPIGAGSWWIKSSHSFRGRPGRN